MTLTAADWFYDIVDKKLDRDPYNSPGHLIQKHLEELVIAVSDVDEDAPTPEQALLIYAAYLKYEDSRYMPDTQELGEYWDDTDQTTQELVDALLSDDPEKELQNLQFAYRDCIQEHISDKEAEDETYNWLRSHR